MKEEVAIIVAVYLTVMVSMHIFACFILNAIYPMPPIEPRPQMEMTDFGWALVSDTMPPRGETNVWLKLPERHVYMWDGDGWERVSPPEPKFITINHG